MKRKMIVMVAALLLLVSIVLPISDVQAATKEASGTCTLSHTGRSVKFRGVTSSSKDEEIIRVVVTLQEQRDGVWHSISSVSKTEYNTDIASAKKSYTVTGGYYYRVIATHYVKTGNVVSTASSETPSTWIS